MPIIRTMELLGASSPCQMMLKWWRRELGHLQVECSVDTRLQALFASVYSEIDSQNRQYTEILDTETKSEVEHATALHSSRAALPRLQ